MFKHIGANERLPAKADTVLDLSGQILLPGFVNTHHHLNQTLTRNLPTAQNNNLFPWLQAQYRIWARTTEKASRASTLIGLAELALSGCTTVFDHTYVFKNGNNVDCQIQAAKELGVRFHASRGSMSLGQSQGGLPPDDCVEDEEFVLRDSERVIKAFHDASPGSMTQIVLAPCSPFSVTISLLRDSAALARQYKVKLHTHLCETRDEERYTLERYQLHPVDWMETHGWLGNDVWFAHAIHVDDDEIKKFAQTGCGAAHCPCSNMRLGSGIAPIKKYLAAGVKVGLGVDGSASNDASNILLEARQAMLLARLQMGLLPPEGSNVTEVILSKIKPGMDGKYREWSVRIQSAQAKYPGYRGMYLQPPTEKEGFWTTMIRFDTAEHLEGWMKAPERAELLVESKAFIESEQLMGLATSFPGWVPINPMTGKGPPNWKTALLVVLGLFPIVMLEMRFLSPILSSLGLHASLATFIGNCISVAGTTFITMPLFIRWFGWWLFADKNAPAWIGPTGLILLAVLFGIEVSALWNLLPW